MTRITQQHANDYGSIENIQEEFAYLYQYLLSAERGTRTLNDMIGQLFDGNGLLMGLLEFRWESNSLEYRVNNGSWKPTGATITDLQGPPGASGSGTGDMVQATYDPNNDGRIAINNLDIQDNDIAQVKVSGLVADLLSRMVVYAQPTVPPFPTYPPSGPVTGWLDTSDPTQPVFKYWDGAGAWRQLTDEILPTTTINNGKWLAGENILSRAAVFLALTDRYGPKLTGLTATASTTASGTAAATIDDIIPGTAWVANDGVSNIKYVTAAAVSVGMMEVWFANATARAFIIETSNDGTIWSPVLTIASAAYTVGQPAQFVITTPNSATQIRLRQTAGAAMQINEVRLYERPIVKGRAYNIDTDAVNPSRVGDIIGIALDAGPNGSYFTVLVAAGEVSGMTGLSPGAPHYTTTVPGAVSPTPGKNSVVVGIARTPSIMQFIPNHTVRPVGEIFLWGGLIADIPPGCALCDGAAYSRTQYPVLFARIGTVHGAGDGQTTANLPDLRERFIVGASVDGGGAAQSTVEGAAAQKNAAYTFPRTEQLLAGGGGGSTGGTTAAANVAIDAPPFYAVAFCIKLQ